jgi:hypothetical protein
MCGAYGVSVCSHFTAAPYDLMFCFTTKDVPDVFSTSGPTIRHTPINCQTVNKLGMVQTDSGTKIDAMAIVGSVILTVAAIIASWPATAFLLTYYADPQNTGALIVGASFPCLQLYCGVQQVGVG